MQIAIKYAFVYPVEDSHKFSLVIINIKITNNNRVYRPVEDSEQQLGYCVNNR